MTQTRAWRLFWRPLNLWVSGAIALLCALVFAGSAVFTDSFLNHAYQRYTVTLEDIDLTNCLGSSKGGVGDCHAQEQVRFSDGSTGSYAVSDGGSFDPTINGDFDSLETPTPADFGLRIGGTEHLWLVHRSDHVAYDYAPNTSTTVVVRFICFFGFFIFGIRALVLNNRRRK